MLRFFRSAPQSDAALTPGRRIYAVGDIHGRLDLLDDLLGRIEEDNASRDGMRSEIILLGDLIDRGPDSAGVVRRVMEGGCTLPMIVLKGNHEAALVESLDGDRKMMAMWLKTGGKDTLISFGMSPDAMNDASVDEAIEIARGVIPADIRRWIARLPLRMQMGDYLFVHAGVRPGVKLDRQSDHDAMWIREDFLGSTVDHGAIIVHGHSIAERVEERGNRIGLDTGAYRTGRLTAVGLEGTDRWFLDTASPQAAPVRSATAR